jgi:hypothetical protein
VRAQLAVQATHAARAQVLDQQLHTRAL